jgi:hypothetical protein
MSVIDALEGFKTKIFMYVSIESGLDSNYFIGNSLVDIYAKCGDKKSPTSLVTCMYKELTTCWLRAT